MDSDSDWEPPKKRRKLNNNKAKAKTKKKTKHKSKRKQRKRKIRKHQNYNKNNNDSDSSIEILPNKNKRTTKRVIQSKKSTKKKTKPRKQRKKKFKAVSTAINSISNMDTLICGMYHSSNTANTNDLNVIIPTDITDLICNYQKNIHYVNVNFVWTHKYQCCSNYRKCSSIKNNRGSYVFERDANNRFDSNAIKIMTRGGKHVGYVPRDTASCLAPLLDENKIDLCCVGGEKTKPCSEMVEIIPLMQLTNQELQSLEYILETVPYDQNRYVHS